jgi:DNA-binding transcriptional MerR regulator/methylmalonyl-CoA mutase cobalamin-binding subunit
MNGTNDDSGQYLIKTVSKRSGVKSDLVRAWERRYQAVNPTRTSGGHRVYTDQDIARLKLLNQATSNGHSISQIAQYSLDALKNLVKNEPDLTPKPLIISSTVNNRIHLADAYIEKCYAAVLAFDAKALESHFENAIVELGTEAFIEHLLTPLLSIIGERWKTGELRPVHEHMTSSVIRSLTYILRNNHPCRANAPRMIVSTPIGQLHELGALLAAIMAELCGWQVTYLGANLAAEEIAAAIKYTNACALTLSISFATDDHIVPKELRRLKKLIGNDVSLIVGGRAASHFEAVLNEVGVVNILGYAHFREVLAELAGKNLEQENLIS